MSPELAYSVEQKRLDDLQKQERAAAQSEIIYLAELVKWGQFSFEDKKSMTRETVDLTDSIYEQIDEDLAAKLYRFWVAKREGNAIKSHELINELFNYIDRIALDVCEDAADRANGVKR